MIASRELPAEVGRTQRPSDALPPVQHRGDAAPATGPTRREHADPTPPLVVDAEVPLESLWNDLEGRSYVLAVDRRAGTAGVVAAETILERRSAPNETERLRWGRMPVGTLLAVRFPCGGRVESLGTDTPPAWASLTDDEHLVGILTTTDVFVSWQRLQELLSGASADPLTGLLNRGAFERRLAEEWARAERRGFSVAVVVIDLDHFKEFNDAFGHAAGDEALRVVGKMLEKSFRSYDVVTRYGGDEFAAVCLGCCPGDIEIPLKRVFRNLAHATTQFRVGGAHMSASLGAAVRHSGFREADPRELFVAADKCLYRAKSLRSAAYYIEFGADRDSELVRLDLAE